MPTQNVKHRMLVEAKRIAIKEFTDIKIINLLDNQEIIILKKENKKNAIDVILLDHPEFDPNTFKKMIRDMGVRNKQKEE